MILMFRIMTKMNIVMTTSTPNHAAENEDVNNSLMLQFSYLTCLQTTTFILLRISLLVEKISLKA